MRNKRFHIGFAVASVAFALANAYSYETARPLPGCDDCPSPFGVPLPLGEFGGWGQTHYFVSGVVADIAIGLAASALLGWALARAVPPLVARGVRVAAAVADWQMRTRL